MEKSAELVLIPFVAKGHLPGALELAKLVVSRDARLSVTVLIMNVPLDPSFAGADSVVAAFPPSPRIKFARITNDGAVISGASTANPIVYINKFNESLKLPVKNYVSKMVCDEGRRVAGFVLDVMMMPMADVADEFGVPTYVYWASGAGSLSLALRLLQIRDRNKNVIKECGKSESLDVPGFTNGVPVRVIPAEMMDNDHVLLDTFMSRVRKAKGVVLNTSNDIDPRVITSLIASDSQPSLPIYPVGPLLNLPNTDVINHARALSDGTNIMEWLNIQPRSSVVFLCFGSAGCFSPNQVKEIALALEKTGFRFVWALQVSPPTEDLLSALPEGFLNRTATVGKVLGWAPQAGILAHPAVGGFVSHAGWNSLLESMWFGVPVATWPLYAEHHLNSFLMTVELGLAVEVDLEGDGTTVVKAKAIEAAMRSVMAAGSESEVKKRLKEMSEKCKKAVAEGGSSLSSADTFVSDVFESLQLH